MIIQKNPNTISAELQTIGRTVASLNGNVMVYLIVVILIFGVLGVTIVSLFTTATSSSATPNNARRAAYVTESAMRYALSELRNSGFDTGVVDSLNTTTYTVNPAGSFTLNIFSPWFVAAENYEFGGGGGTLTLNVPVGKLTPGWMANDLTRVWVINYDYLDKDLASARDPAASWIMIDATTLTLTVNGDITVNKGERICFMVKPKQDQTGISAHGDLLVEEAAKDFFPEYNGAISINRIHYVYEQLIHEPANNRVKLKNISAAVMPNPESASAFPLNVYIAEDFIVLSPRNYFVIPTGTADTVSVAGTLDRAVNIYDSATVKPGGHSDISLNQYDLDDDLNAINRTDRDFITVDDDENTINIGSNLEGQTDFGGIWFNTDATIGGKANVCNAGACEFGRGVRVFFTLDYNGNGAGLTFALINAEHNTTSSIGGDIDVANLLGYAGDSRKKADPTAAEDFLDVTGAEKDPPNPGLHPPKLALEFDAWNNNLYQAYCDGETYLIGNRNDPLTDGRDALQYVFWGFTSLAVPCRDYTIGTTTVTDHPTYDDNRHDAGELAQPWPPYETSGPLRSTPAVADDGTIYVGSDDSHLYAIDPEDGSRPWRFHALDANGDNIHDEPMRSSPAIGTNGLVYFGTDGGKIFAINSNGVEVWSYLIHADYPVRSPVIGDDGKVYVGSDNGKFYGFTASLGKLWEFTAAGPISFGRPTIGPTGSIYISHRSESNGRVYALNPTWREDDDTGIDFPGDNTEWEFDVGDGSAYMPGVDPTSGTIYSDRSGNKIVAITPGGDLDWEFNLGDDFDSTPVVGADGTVYFGADNAKLYALNPGDRKNGESFPTSREWTFPTGGQVDTTPAIAPDGTILVLSSDGNLYAVNPDGTEKWSFPIPVSSNLDIGELNSSPTVGSDGTVYIGSSSDKKLYAINNFAVPRNIRHLYVTSVIDGTNDTVGGEIVTLDDDINWLGGAATAGPWAVRLEVMRSLSQNADLKYEYTLRSWIRQCATDACANLFGTFYEDTRIQYSATPHLAQTIALTEAEHLDFATFIFGFTGAVSGANSQSAEITDFKLSFIRFNDPIAP
jgi:outer membrane protein assembly factor BamB/type II secretory pathway pseudopilin PulG